MAAVIIRKKDVEQLGKELVKEIFEFLHDEMNIKKVEYDAMKIMVLI